MTDLRKASGRRHQVFEGRLLWVGVLDSRGRGGDIGASAKGRILRLEFSFDICHNMDFWRNFAIFREIF